MDLFVLSVWVAIRLIVGFGLRDLSGYVGGCRFEFWVFTVGFFGLGVVWFVVWGLGVSGFVCLFWGG